MMNKQKKRTRWVYTAVAPLVLITLFSFSNRKAFHAVDQVESQVSLWLEPSGSYDLKEPSILPLKDASRVKVTSTFGMRKNPLNQRRQLHTGIDFGCEIGTQLIATADGTVTFAGVKSRMHGVVLEIDHEDGFATSYWHLSKTEVQVGDKVSRGQLVALSGNSGASTGPHVHYEVRKDGESVDPLDYIKNYRLGGASDPGQHDGSDKTNH